MSLDEIQSPRERSNSGARRRSRSYSSGTKLVTDQNIEFAKQQNEVSKPPMC
jgi:hypothetical protein